VAHAETVDVVVGAGSGMGTAVAAALRGDRRILVVDQHGDTATRVANTLAGAAEPVQCDITDASACAELASRLGKLGKLGKLVVTAGLSPTMAPGERIFAVNLVGNAKLLAALDDTVTAGTSAVLFASIAGHGPAVGPEVAAVLDDPLTGDLPGRLRAVGVEPSDPGVAYGLSKLGVIRLARRTAPSWWRRGARILSLSPGIIDTPMGNQELSQQPMMRGMIDLVGRMGTPEEVAAVAAFLVSEAASFMSGCDVLVDGGFVAMAGEGS
jgi:NAD(P)-dependent dehydrogenase (short-subunit alcohol dehydrogenase family)